MMEPDDQIKPVSTNKIADTSTNHFENKTNTVKEKYPKIVSLIIVNEFCERFSFYGFRTILYIFFTSFLNIDKDTATAMYHAFTMLCYFTPILGAILADGYIGLYKTIVSLSIFYALGEILLTITSMKPLGAPNAIGPIIGLIIIAFGTGGIKPCVSAFGGNQFRPSQRNYLANFFSMFYLSINIGSTIGTLITPIFRSDVKCFGNDCYPLAFGFPALLMIIATIVFLIGTPFYRRDNDKPKGSENIIVMTARCIFTAIKNKIKSPKFDKREHWLDYASENYSKKLISDVKIFCKIVFVFLPLPFFWALYDQQGSRWTSQAQQLNGRVGGWTIKPDQFQAVNPVLIVILVPIFDFVIYPLFAKVNLFKKQLQRMSMGLIITVLAFLISAFLEYNMNLSVAKLNPSNRIKVLNLSPCTFDMSTNENSKSFNIIRAEYLKNKAHEIPSDFINELNKNSNFTELTFQISGTCKQENKADFSIQHDIVVNNLNLPKSILIYLNAENQKLNIIDYEYNLDKSVIGFSEIKLSSFQLDDVKLKPIITNEIVTYDKFKIDSLESNSVESLNNSTLDVKGDYMKIDYAEYDFKVLNDQNEKLLESRLLFETCNKYTILLFPNTMNSSSIDFILLTDVHSSGIHLAWQLIQIFVITMAEVMFSISGLAFAYAEAPQSMKSVLSAVWLLTVALGNLVVVLVAESRFVSNQVYEYLLFAGLLVVATVVFIILAIFYKYTDEFYEEKEEEKTISEVSQSNEKLDNQFDSIKKLNEDEISLGHVKAIESN